MPLIKGQTYNWNQILAETNSVSGPVFYLLHRGGSNLITAAAIDIAMNSRAPYEIWAGDGEHVRQWADILDAQIKSFDTFVREADGQYYYRGRFRRKDSSTTPHEISLRMAQLQRGPIYKIIFLEESLPDSRR